MVQACLQFTVEPRLASKLITYSPGWPWTSNPTLASVQEYCYLLLHPPSLQFFFFKYLTRILGLH